MKHHIQAVLFDLDGVVAFTDSYHFKAWEKLSIEQGWKFDETLNNKLRGIPRLASLQVILDHNGVTLSSDKMNTLAEIKNGYYVESLSDISREALYPGIIEFLDLLRQTGVKIGLCSSSKNTHTVINSLDIARYFDTVVTGLDIEKAKPHPEIFLKAANHLRVPPFHCIVFEDAQAGIEAGQRAGMKCIGVGTEENLPNAPELVVDYSTVDIEALLDAGRPFLFEIEPWSIRTENIRPQRAQYWETVFALSNGYIGMRGSPEEENPLLESYRGTFINRFVGYEKYNHIWEFPGYAENLHAMLNVCDWSIVNLSVDGEVFTPGSGKIQDHSQVLDLRRGILKRSFCWSTPSGKRVNVKTQRLISMRRRHCGMISYSVTSLDKAEISLSSCVSFDMKSQVLSAAGIEAEKYQGEDTCDTFTISSNASEQKAAASFIHRVAGSPEGAKQSRSFENGRFEYTYTVSADKNSDIHLEKYASFYTSLDNPPDAQCGLAEKAILAAAEDGSDVLIKEQDTFWQTYWDNADISVEGNMKDQQAIRFTLFQLRQSNPEDETRSIGANGMTGDKYCGHVFWDTEMYMFPNFLYTEPDTVKPLLMYRYNILELARERARQLQGPGACYSWNSITGEECCVVFEAATAEYHLQNAIAYGIWRYTEQSGDTEFLHNFGAEIVFETARFMHDLGGYVPTRNNAFCINAVCGPDEYGCGVNNNCYTNAMTQWHFLYASKIYKEMEHSVPEALKGLQEKIGLNHAEAREWKKAAESMYIPFNEELGIHMQDDSFLYLEPVDMELIPKNTDIRERMHPLNLWRKQVLKQADILLLMFIQGHQFSMEHKKANYEYYEPKTCHGSSLSACIHSIIASEINKPEDAYYYFRQSALMDLNDFKNNTSGGIHSASLGGTWMAVVNGFAGMRDNPEGLHFTPNLPEQWSSCSFTIKYRGSRIQVEMKKEKTAFTLKDGTGCKITVSGKEEKLSKEKSRLVL